MSITIWELRSPEATRGLADWTDAVDTEKLTCKVNPGHQRGGRRITELQIELPTRKVPDLVWTWGSELLVQDRVLRLLQEQEFTGFMANATKCWFRARGDKSEFRPEQDAEPDLWLWDIIVTGWAGVAPLESGIRKISDCPSCGSLKYSGLSSPERLFDESQWDGSDFFMIWPLPKFRFVTDRVAAFLRAERLKGFRLLNITELPPTHGFGPGRLSYWMPDDRARQLGSPLGIY